MSEKTLILLDNKFPEAADRSEFIAVLSEIGEHSAELNGLSVTFADAQGTPGAVVEVWGGDDASIADQLRGRGNELFIMPVRESLDKGARANRLAGPAGGVRQIACLRGRTALSRDELLARWDAHVPLALRVHVGATRYVRNWGLDSGAAPWDGIAFLDYPSVHDFEHRRYDLPSDADVIRADVGRFVGAVAAGTGVEHIVVPPRP